MENQAYLFFIFILNGFLIGLIFDVFRIIRKSFKTSNLITYIHDILFWLLSGAIVLYSIFKFNNGELRGYIFIGILMGTILYLLLFSKIFITVNVFVISLLKKIVYYSFILPIKTVYKYLKRTILKPIRFIFINLRKTMSKFRIKRKKLEKLWNNKRILLIFVVLYNV